jgi:hypothetical protein
MYALRGPDTAGQWCRLLLIDSGISVARSPCEILISCVQARIESVVAVQARFCAGSRLPWKQAMADRALHISEPRL